MANNQFVEFTDSAPTFMQFQSTHPKCKCTQYTPHKVRVLVPNLISLSAVRKITRCLPRSLSSFRLEWKRQLAYLLLFWTCANYLNYTSNYLSHQRAVLRGLLIPHLPPSLPRNSPTSQPAPDARHHRHVSGAS